jgi:NodT family efflux transporter outer membrane factor (OMF) lipoprotein
MKLKTILFLCFLLLISSCAGEKDLKSDVKNDVKDEFINNSSQINNAKPNDKWWEEFDDEFLNQLIEIGLKNNKDIQLSNISIITARQLNNIDAAALLPSGKIEIGRQKFVSPAFGPNGIKYNIYQSFLDASWELDFLGKNLDLYKAGKLRFLEEIQIYKANSIRVVSEIAQNYISLKAKQKQIKNLEEILRDREELSKIIQEKEALGVAFKTQIYQSQIDYNLASSDLTSAKTDEKIITYRLAVLLGITPEKVLELLKSTNNKKQIFDYYSGIVPLGLKSDILRRRPDIIAAEYEIDATLYEKSSQFKQFFPSFNLTARFGSGAKDVGDLFKNGANVKDIIGGISLPLFSIPELMAQYKISKAKAKTALINYEKTVIDAVADCESQLAKYIDALAIEKNAEDAKSASDKILQITKNKKLIGASSKEDLLNSKINNLNNEILLAQKKSESLSHLIALHKAIGGGFEGYEIKLEKDRVQFVEIRKTPK